MKNIAKSIFLCSIITVLLFGCQSKIVTPETAEPAINTMLDQWHKAAAEANFNNYFGAMTNDAIFIGTDPTENWKLDAFKAFAKPYFDKGKAWSFTPLERNVYFDPSGKLAWFDELLDTQMKLCRGSGVVVLENDQWKVKHYVLSIAIPNENVKEIIQIKQQFDENLTKKLK